MLSIFLQKLAFLSESKRDWIKKTYGLTDEQVNLCLKADPEEGTYVPWIANNLKNKTIRLPEDESKIREQLTEFNKLKNSPNFDNSKDIGTYSPSDLYELVQSSKPENLSEKEQIKRLIERGAPGAELVVNKDDYKIFKVTDPKLLMVLSSNTNWCTAQLRYAKSYLKDSSNYVFYYQNKPYAQWDSKNQLMDKEDVSLASKESAKIAENGIFIEFYKLFPLLHDHFWINKEDIYKIPKAAYWYAKSKIKGRWPEGEPTIMKDPEAAYDYARDIIKGRWPKAEPTIMKDFLYAYCYALNVIKSRWPAAEPTIMKDPEAAYNYAAYVIKGRWPAAEPTIMKDPGWAYYYAKNIINKRWPKSEPYIIKIPRWACYYAEDVIRGRWPEAEPTIMKDPGWAYLYVRYVIKGRWPEAEPYIMKDPKWAYEYAKDVIGGRWPKAEPIILASNYAALYKQRFNIK